MSQTRPEYHFTFTPLAYTRPECTSPLADIISLYWGEPFLQPENLGLGVLFVRPVSAPPVCVHTPVSMEPCTGERGKAKQNKTVPGLVVAGSELAKGTWKQQHIAMVWVRDY